MGVACVSWSLSAVKQDFREFDTEVTRTVMIDTLHMPWQRRLIRAYCIFQFEINDKKMNIDIFKV